MFQNLESSGLRGFLGVSGLVYEEALTLFTVNFSGHLSLIPAAVFHIRGSVELLLKSSFILYRSWKLRVVQGEIVGRQKLFPVRVFVRAGRAAIPHSHLPAGIVATMRRVVNYHSSWARQQWVELFDASGFDQLSQALNCGNYCTEFKDVRASGNTALSSPCWDRSHHEPSGLTTTVKRQICDNEKMIAKKMLKTHEDSRATELKKKRIAKRKSTVGDADVPYRVKDFDQIRVLEQLGYRVSLFSLSGQVCTVESALV
ncbi:DNA ligase 1-like [Dorcoceras hygrometricum]|uniref:DNA ligase 1-like n=1 Tax=Dorcoceras hygrometricum TaxID=472368 RepID=A0A2Z7CXI0_9LAMI|nr:DNA ligase 1-like [Dorcoceras hygrometricum]